MNLSSLFIVLPIILPLLVATLAGLLRQDRLPDWANEGITLVLLLAGATTYAFFQHKLTNNGLLDFIVIAAYATSLIQMPQLKALQGYLQSNVLTLLKGIGSLPPPPAPPAQIVPLPAKPVQHQAPPKSMNGG